MMNATIFRRLCRVPLAMLALGLSASAHTQTTYTIVDLGTLGGYQSYGFGINASGQVVGTSYLAGDDIEHAFLYSDSIMQDLGTLGGSLSYGDSINDSGQIAGEASTFHNDTYHAVLWTGDTITDLHTSGGISINTSGQVAGFSTVQGSSYGHAVVWTGATMQDLGTLGETYSYGYGINDSGQVAGYYGVGAGVYNHAFRYSGTTMQDLGTLGGNYSYGYGINNSGQVAGYSDTIGDIITHAVRWTGTTAADLGTLGGTNSYGQGINASGDVVGYSDTASGATTAFLYSGGRMIDLNPLLPTDSGWQLHYAYGINDNGWITGQGTINGHDHAFLLKPNLQTITGRIALEGVPDLTKTNSAAPLGTFHVSFRTPGTTTEVYSVDVTLMTTAGSAFGTYAISNIPVGTYDITIKGSKNLRVVLPSLAISGNASLPDVTLPAGDANNDNGIDIVDFEALVNAYGGDAGISGSGYDPTADFNFDGVVNVADFSLLVNEYGNTGAP